MQSLLSKISIQLSACIATLLAIAASLTGLGWIVSESIESTFRSEVEREQRASLDHYADRIRPLATASRVVLNG